jgi:hypothetical protein
MHAMRVKRKSVYYGKRIFDKSLSCRDLILDRSIFCRDFIVDRSMSYKNLIIDRSISCKDMVVTTSLYCRDHLVDTIFGTLRDIPVKYKDGEFIVNARDGIPGVSHASSGCSEGSEGAEGTKKIYILLTKHKNIAALLLRLFTWHEYTHSSIALERDGAHYSFNPVRGFTIERPIHKKRGATPCRLYCVEVDDSAYAEIESRIKWFVDNPDEYKFNYVGLVFSILRIPIGVGNRYFCSQFVSDMLTKADATALRKRPNRYFPRHFPKEDSFTMTFQGEAASFIEGTPDTVSSDQKDSSDSAQ